MGWDGMGCDGMGWDGMGWDGVGWDGMGWDGVGWDEESMRRHSMGTGLREHPQRAAGRRSTLTVLVPGVTPTYLVYSCQLALLPLYLLGNRMAANPV